MSSHVLLEAYNAALPQGTGMATYIRNLTLAAKANGYTVDGLLHSFSKPNRRDQVLNEISFYDARNIASSKFPRKVEDTWRQLIGCPFGINATPLVKSGMIIDSGTPAFRAVNSFDNAYVARLFMDFSRYHFSRYGTAARLNLPHPPDLFHGTQVIPLKVSRAANIYTIHDLVPLLLPNTTLDDKKFFLSAVRHLCRQADHIVTVSEASRANIISMTGIPESRITNTYQAVSIPREFLLDSTASVESALENLFGLTHGGYHLFCGALEPKKNVSRLISAYAASGSKYPLIIAGPLGWEYQRDLAQIDQESFVSWKMSGNSISQEKKVRRLDFLPLAHLVTLIRGARSLVFPSLYEGFGLPVLEAMLLGAPVITSNTTALAEITGSAALLVDPLDIQALTRAIRTIDADDDLRKDLIERGQKQAAKFSPEEYQHRVGTLYRGLIG